MSTPARRPFLSADEAFALVSRQLDEQLDPAERADLELFETAHPEQVAEFRSQCISVGNAMRQLPVIGVPRLLFVSDPEVEVETAPVTIQRNGNYRLILSLVTSVMCAVLVLAVMRNDDVQQNTTSALAPPDALVAFQPPGAAAKKVLAADHLIDASSPSDAAALASSLPPSEPSPALAFQDSDPEIESLVESDNWRVLVVKVDSDDRDLAMDRIRAITEEHGLRLKLSSGDSATKWLGVVLTSVETTNELVTAMETSREVTVPKREAESETSTGQQILTVVRESLRFPTRSELHHGKVFVALPVQSGSAKIAAVQDEIPAPKSKADVSRMVKPEQQPVPASRAAAAGASLSGDESAALNDAAQAGPPVTLVVFQFPDSTAATNSPEADAPPR